MQLLKEQTCKAASFLKGLASEHRLSILCAIADGEMCVGAIQEKTGMPQTSVSQHLAKLKQEGIVNFRREHRTLHYYISNNEAKDIMKILHTAFCEAQIPAKSNTGKNI